MASDIDPGEGLSMQVGDREGGSGERGEERAEGSVGVPGHTLFVLLVLSTEAGGISATKLLIVATVVNVDAEEGANVTSGGAALSMVDIFVDNLGETGICGGRWNVIAFPFFRFRMTRLDTPRTGTREASEGAEAAGDEMTI